MNATIRFVLTKFSRPSKLEGVADIREDQKELHE